MERVRIFRAGRYATLDQWGEDPYDRQRRLPGHDQEILGQDKVVQIGAGGLGSSEGLILVRSGVRHLTIIDPDRFEPTNLNRQLCFEHDLGEYKAVALARNLLPHAPNGAVITAVPDTFEAACEELTLSMDLLLCLVDRNDARLAAAREARRRRIPAVFAMLSRDSMRFHAFLQGPNTWDACLWCALPDLDPEEAAPCADALMVGCAQAATHAAFFALRAMMGWPPGVEPFNWREGDLFGVAPGRVGRVLRRPDCPVCSDLR